jgi:hypothetical protein
MTVSWSKLICPECRTALKPTKPVPTGKKVKCPECGFTFPAPGAREEPAARKPKAAPGQAARKPAAKPAPKKAPRDDDEEGGGTYAFIGEGPAAPEEEDKPDINYAPDMSIKDLRGPAQAAVVRPSNWLILQGIAGFLGWLGFLIILLIPILFPLDDSGTEAKPKPALMIGTGLGAGASGGTPFRPPNQAGKPKEEDEQTTFFILLGWDLTVLSLYAWWLMALLVLPLLLGLVYSAILTLGAVKMQNLESRGWGIASCIMVMVPINAGGIALLMAIFGRFLLNMLFDEAATVNMVIVIAIALEWLSQIGIGVWALRTLLQPAVIAGYEYVAD